jgi:hypothetical protein
VAWGKRRRAFAGKNPFAPGPGFNLTKQGEILRSDPEAAKHDTNETAAKFA